MKRKEVQFKKKFHLLEILLLFNLSFPISIAKDTEKPISYCGSRRIQTPFYLQNGSQYSSILNHMLLCKSKKLYLRTSLGLFQISSIDYSGKLLTVSHTSCSSTSHFISPTLLTAGLPPPPQPNSLVFFNCSSQEQYSSSLFVHNCTYFNGCGGSSSSYCLVFEDVGKLDQDFHPREMNCTHYRRIHRTAASGGDEFEQLGTRISFDIPGHVPNPCDECKKPHGNCGAALRCICHPKECKVKISSGVILKPFGGKTMFSFLIGSMLVMFIFNQS